VEGQILDTDQVAKRLKVSRNTVRRLIEDGQLAAYNIARSGQPRYRVRESAIDDYLATVAVPRDGRAAVAG
jgi:excisionase family DNA binding protein